MSYSPPHRQSPDHLPSVITVISAAIPDRRRVFVGARFARRLGARDPVWARRPAPTSFRRCVFAIGVLIMWRFIRAPRSASSPFTSARA